MYLFIACLPIVSIIIGIALLAAGFALQKKNRLSSKGLLIAGGVFAGIFILDYAVFFLIGALGMNPVAS